MDRIDGMRVFVRVAHLSSFAAAARELRLSAATVTKQVSALERQLGVRLLERTTRKVQLTEAGRFYLDRCGETLQSFDDTEAAMSELRRQPAGVLRVTGPLDFGRELALVTAAFQRDFPSVTVDLRLANHNIDLIEQGFDLGIGLPSPSHASYVARRLCTWRVALYATPAYLAEHGTPRKPADLAGHRHVVFVEPQPRTEWSLRKGNRTVKVELRAAAMSNSGSAIVELALAGVGMVVAPSVLVVDEVTSGRLVRVLGDHDLGGVPVFVRYPSRRFLPAKVRCFLEALRGHFGPDPEADRWWVD